MGANSQEKDRPRSFWLAFNITFGLAVDFPRRAALTPYSGYKCIEAIYFAFFPHIYHRLGPKTVPQALSA